MILAILIAILIPCLYFFLIWSSEIYATSRASLTVRAFAWGIISFGLALMMQLIIKEAREGSARLIAKSLQS
jgi:hypothetical protein